MGGQCRCLSQAISDLLKPDRLHQIDVFDDDLSEGVCRSPAKVENGYKLPQENEDVKKATKVHLDVFNQNDGRCDENGVPRRMWVAIGQIAYDVTDFGAIHPGGEDILKKHAAKDATIAFQRARHSSKAKAMMHKYVVGPIEEKQTEYRIFEHAAEARLLAWEAGTRIGSYMIIIFLLGISAYSSHEETSTLAIAHVVPGLLLIAIGGVSLSVVLCVFGKSRIFVLWPQMHRYLFGLCTSAFYVGLVVARQKLPREISTCPSGLELSVVVWLCLEEFLETQEEFAVKAKGLTLSFCAVLFSWVGRDAWKLMYFAPQHLLAPLLIGPSAIWIIRRVREDRERAEIVNEVLEGVQCAGFLSFFILMFLTWTNADISASVTRFLSLSWGSYCVCLLTAGISLLVIIMMANSAYVCSAAWSSRAAACTFGLLIILSGGISSYGWLKIFAFFVYLGASGHGHRHRFNRVGQKSCFSYQLGTRRIWDRWRLILLFWAWSQITLLIQKLCNYILPEGIEFFAASLPFFDLGKNVNLGVAYLHTPKEFQSQNFHQTCGHATIGHELEIHDPGRPDRIDCNSSHVDISHASGLNDFMLGMRTIRDDWARTRGTPGLLANVACMFPVVEGTSFAKLIQLETWNADEEAKAPKSGQKTQDSVTHVASQKTRGTMHASLSLVGEIIHQDRCSRCSRVVEAERPGVRAPLICNICQGVTFGYPFI